MRQFLYVAALAGFLTAASSSVIAQEQDRTPTAAEAAIIANYKAVINATFDSLAKGGWNERQPNHMDIPPDVQVLGWTRGPFTFEGDISRMFEPAPADAGPSRSDQIQAIMAKYMQAKTASEKQALMSQMQALATAPVEQPSDMDYLISSVHNQGYYVPDSEHATRLATPPPGVAVAFEEASQQIQGSKVYVLEFCDPARFVYDTTLQAYPYKYVHNDGSPHIEEIEIRIEGPAATVDAALKDTDWTKVDAALNP
ncbi:MAG: hypothetical protein WDN06_19760 [Asticcacaulis sp.]